MFACDPPGESDLSVEGRQRLVHVGELRFEFDHEQVTGLAVPAQLIDRTSFAVHRKRHFRLKRPLVECRDGTRETCGQE